METQKLQIEEFEKALEESKIQNHIEYDVRDWLYVPNHYGEYRYILGTTGRKPLICIGINPSTAAPNKLDNTLKSVERIAKGNGFDGVTALGKVHTHLFLLGMTVFLIVSLFAAHNDLKKHKTFKVFMWVYNIGVVLTAAMLVARGVPQVLSASLSSSASLI